jgi:biopolymer transport protein ExbD
MKVRCGTTSISALVLSLCLVASIPAALSNASTWNESSIKLPYGAMWNFLAPLGFAYLGIVAIGLIVLWTGYRRKERWAWFVMLIALLFFYFPFYALPVLLQIRRFGWPYLLYLLGAFRLGGWWYCWIASFHPGSAVGMANWPIATMIRPLEFLVMLIALLLPAKAFFWRPTPCQLGMRTKIAALLGKRTWVLALALLLAIVIAIALMVRNRLASYQNSVAENWQSNVTPWFPRYPMVQIDLAKAENAVAMPEAGNDDATVVAVTRNGMVFLGTNKIDPAELGSYVRDKLANKIDKTIYLRADARTRYREVENAIDNLRITGAKEVGLLTKRKKDDQPENYLWIGNPLIRSVGLEVLIPSLPETPTRVSSLQDSDSAIIVHVIYRPNEAPAYKIDGGDVAHDELRSKLAEIYAHRAERMMFVQGDDKLRFSDIADVIDIGIASNADHIGLVTQRVTAGN